jgi:hypothetical protein
MCGAPLPEPAKPARPVKPLAPPTQRETQEDIRKVREAGEKLDETANKVWYTYGAVVRVLAEAIVIALVAFAIGFTGGIVALPVVGVVGAVITGTLVGIAVKASYITLVSAPLGMVVGTVFGAILWLLGVDAKLFVFVLPVFAGAAALLGGRRIPYERKKTWEKLRPFIGAVGGLAFGVLGVLLGSGLQMLVENVL